MTETRTKVYQGLQEQQRDEADAAAHGWRVVARESEPQGYRVTYELGPEWADASEPIRRRRGLRKATWLVIIWNVAFLLLFLVLPGARGYIDGSYEESITRFAESALLVGLGFIWFIGFLVTGLIWFMSRPRA